MAFGRLGILCLMGALLVGCAATSKQTPPVGENQPCEAEEASRGKGHQSIDAVFVQQGVLFGIDLKSRSVRKLVSRLAEADFTVESAQFSRNGNTFAIQRGDEGQARWWTAYADGSALRQVALPAGRKVVQVVPLCMEGFVGLVDDGRFIRFDAKGHFSYWTPAENDMIADKAHLVGAPGGKAVAYPSRTGVVVLVPKAESLAVSARVPGKVINGWIGDTALVASDGETLHVLTIAGAMTRQLEFKSVLSKSPRLVTVAVHPNGDLMYVVSRSSIPQTGAEVVAVSPETLGAISPMPHKVPKGIRGAPQFSPHGAFEAWPVNEPKEVAYAAPVAITQVVSGEVAQVVDAEMVSVPYAFHPNDDGFVFTDLSRGGTYLVYQDSNGKRIDLARSAEGYPFKSFAWNPILAVSATK